MNESRQYLISRVRTGWGILAVGLVILVTGLVLQFGFTMPFNTRIVSGLGILVAGVGLGQILRYRAVLSDSQAAARLVNLERDERERMIRAAAGNRAFWVSLALTYTLLMWLSLASNGSLPEPDANILWFYLAGAVILSFAVYIASILYDQKHG